MALDTTAPELHFPYEELESRVDYINSCYQQILNRYSGWMEEFSTSRNLADLEEKQKLDTAEQAAGSYLKELILSRYSDDSLLLEDFPETTGKNNFRWVMDPIDGALNFLRRIPLYSISLAIQHRGHNAAGIVVVPGMRDIYTAIHNRGATKNGNSIQVSSVSRLENSVLVPGFPRERKKKIATILSEISSLIVSGKTLRRTGSFCLDMCWLAEGRLDGLWENSLDMEDTAAVSVILQEANGQITDDKNQPFNETTGSVIASNSHIHNALYNLLLRSHNEIHLN